MNKKKESKVVPNVRFKGFTDDWKQCKLGEVSESYSGGTPSVGNKSYYGGSIPFIRSAEINSESTELFLTEEGLTNSSARMVSKGDILYALYGATSGETGRSRINGAINQAILAILPHDGYDSEFLMQWLRKSKQNITDIYLQGGQGNLSGAIVKDLEVNFPSLAEQRQIGNYFQSIDKLITLHQQKITLLTKLKKAMLEKMFPKKGSVIPEFRFNGFANAWEQCKLGELAEIVGGGTPSTSVESYWDGDIDWYAPAEIGEQIYLKSSQRKITEEGLNKSSAKVLPVGTVLFTSRAGIGKTAILLKEGCTNQGFQSIVPNKNKLDSYFIFTRSEELKRYGETVGAGSTFVEVSGKQMANMELMMPTTMDEQQKIGEYFSNLDNLITLHQRKIDKIKNLKKAMLDQIFI